MKLTIILTVYNKEPFLQRAFNSLLNQKDVQVGDYEILAVNDGSTDRSASILEDYVQRESCVRILTQNNQGLSMARNNGVDAALGEYVWFVDADDTISEKAVSLITQAMSTHPDVIPIYAITDGIKKIRNQISPNLITGKDVLIESKWEHCGVFWVFKKNFLIGNNLRFVPGIYHEDAEFTPRMLYLAGYIKVLPEVLYKVYRGDEHSITKVPRPKRAYDMVFVVEQLMAFFNEHGERNSIISKAICNNNAGLLNTALFVMSCNNKEERNKFNDYLYEKKEVLRSFSESSLKKNRLEGFFLRLFPKHCVNVFQLMRKIIS